LVDHSDTDCAPIVYEDHPVHENLVGRIEHLSHMGTLVTDFNLIKAGALHRASGGFLLVDIRRILMQPFAWEGLKRTLKSKLIRIESPGQALGLVSTVSLEPEPAPLDVKVVLIGDRRLYYLLSEYDPDFAGLFKVAADLDDRFVRNPENERLYARLIAGLIRKNDLHPFDQSAVARVVEHSARLVGDSERLSTHIGVLGDLLRESDYWAASSGQQIVSAPDVDRAIDAQIHRVDRVRERLQEEILRNTISIDTTGTHVGQVNGLAVLQLGDYAFGKASRITARIRLGKGEVINIEREVELSGPIHSKGVLILAGFLGARYATNQPLSLSATLVFEQSYSGVDGDSASSTELYALLSAISGIGLRQCLAVTGSVNQHGEVQAIGGANQKIEGFFDLCNARGLTGDQGVLIPATNVKHLMLRREVVEAVEAGRFHIYPVRTIDEGIELLTGVEAGIAGEDGHFPAGTVNERVARRLRELTEAQIAFAKAAESGGSDPEGSS
jgi:lon-related putative ATP-dependent protease